MRQPPTVNDDSLKNGLAVSGVMHLVLFLFLIFGLPHLIPPLPPHHEPVPFQIVTIADMTNTGIKEEPEPQKPSPPQPETKPPAPMPPPPPEQAQPQPPQPPAPPKVEQPPEPQAEALKPKPVEKPKPIEKPAPPPPDLLASVLKNVAKLKPVEEVKTPDTKTDVKAPATPPVAARHLNMAETMSIQDALRRKMEQIWNPPIGARDAQNLIVEIVISVNPDRSIGNVEIVDKARYNTDSFFRAASEAAVRAAHDPRFKLDDIPLTPDTYDDWKHLDLTFDPRDML